MRCSCWNYVENFFHNVPKNDNERRGKFIKNLTRLKIYLKSFVFLETTSVGQWSEGKKRAPKKIMSTIMFAVV